MIRVFATQNGAKCRLWVEGHAAGEERDAVCAGVSALVQSLVLYAQNSSRARYLRCTMAPGQVFFSCIGIAEGFALVLHGLCAIAQTHPQHVQIEFLSVDDKSAQT